MLLVLIFVKSSIDALKRERKIKSEIRVVQVDLDSPARAIRQNNITIQYFPFEMPNALP